MVVMDEEMVRTEMQRQDALDIANRSRSYRAALKRQIFTLQMADGLALVQQTIEFPAPDAETMKVASLIKAVRGYSQKKADKMLRGLRISESKTVCGMTERQRVDLLDELAGLEWRRRREEARRVR